jgi:Tetratricopeptide repeat
MRNLFLIPVIFLLGTFNSFAAADHNSIWNKANTFYIQKQFDSAAYYYEQLAQLKPLNAEVYFNLGNTYYRLNKVGYAVLNFERALKVDPDYFDAKENLALAKERITNHIRSTDNIFFIRWWENITRADKAILWSVSSLLVFIVFIGLIFLRRFSNSMRQKIPSQLVGIMAIVFICLLTLSLVSTNKSMSHDSAVVMQNDAPLLTIDLKGKPIALVPEGTTVSILKENGEWTEVSLPDGRTGVMRSNLIIKI